MNNSGKGFLLSQNSEDQSRDVTAESPSEDVVRWSEEFDRVSRAFENALPASKATAQTDVDRTITMRWGGREEVLDAGWFGVPRAFFFHAAAIGLTAIETAFVLQLMTFKWSEADPFPSYAVLGQRLGMSSKLAGKIAQGLADKGLLRITGRVDAAKGQRTSNAFDLQPLFNRLMMAIKLDNRTGRNSR